MDRVNALKLRLLRQTLLRLFIRIRHILLRKYDKTNVPFAFSLTHTKYTAADVACTSPTTSNIFTYMLQTLRKHSLNRRDM